MSQTIAVYKLGLSVLNHFTEYNRKLKCNLRSSTDCTRFINNRMIAKSRNLTSVLDNEKHSSVLSNIDMYKDWPSQRE